MDILDTDARDDVGHGNSADPLLQLVTCDPAFRGGKSYLRNAGLTVSGILHMLGNGWTVEQIVDDYPRVTRDHVRAALLYAAGKMG